MSDHAFVTETPYSDLNTSGTATVTLLASWRVGRRSNSSSTTRQTDLLAGADLFVPYPQTPFRQDIAHVVAAVADNSDWDSIAPSTRDRAVNLINRFMGAVAQPYQRTANPHISSDGEGGVTFEWWKDTRSLSLFARADGSNSLLLSWGADIAAEMDSIEEPTDDQIRQYWRRLMQG